jgi:hypothetical protein
MLPIRLDTLRLEDKETADSSESNNLRAKMPKEEHPQKRT